MALNDASDAPPPSGERARALYSDVTLRLLGDDAGARTTARFSSSKAVLAASCGVLRRMFADIGATVGSTHALSFPPGTSCAAAELFLERVHGRGAPLTLDACVGLLPIADVLDAPSVTESCASFLLRTLPTLPTSHGTPRGLFGAASPSASSLRAAVPTRLGADDADDDKLEALFRIILLCENRRGLEAVVAAALGRLHAAPAAWGHPLMGELRKETLLSFIRAGPPPPPPHHIPPPPPHARGAAVAALSWQQQLRRTQHEAAWL